MKRAAADDACGGGLVAVTSRPGTLLLCCTLALLAVGPLQTRASNQADMHLCARVDGTLNRILRTFHHFDVPFTRHASAHGNAPSVDRDQLHEHGESRSSLGPKDVELPIDLTPIQQIMQRFGCDNLHARVQRDPTNHSVPSLLEEPRASANASILASQSPYSTPHSSQQLERMRRAERTTPQEGITCTLANVLQNNCRHVNDAMALTIDVDVAVNETAAEVSALHELSSNTASLTLRGDLREETLQWIFANGNWTTCRDLTIREELAFSTFDMSMLNGFSSIEHVRLVHNFRLQGLDTTNFSRKSQLRSLDLQHNSFISLPDNTFEGMTGLNKLNLTHNRLDSLSKQTFAGLSALTHLWLSENLLTALHTESLAGMPELLFTNVSFNKISNISTDAFGMVSNLTHLTLDFNPIRALAPTVFAPLKALEILRLNNILLETLPPKAFNGNTQLKELFLMNNFLIYLPEDVFSGLQELYNLRLTRNRLRKLPPTIFHGLSSLVNISVTDNRLSELPARLLEKCPKLEGFFSSRNELKKVPQDLFHRCPHIQRVFFQDNKLKHFNGVFNNLAQLKTIDAAGNELTQATFDTPLPELAHLRLSNNPLTQLPNFTQLTNLTELRLDQHRIKRLNVTDALQLKLEVLELDAAPDVDSELVVDRGAVAAKNLTSLHLRTLRLENVDVRRAFKILGNLSIQLEILHVGWPGADNQTLQVQNVCSLLSKSVTELGLSNTDFEELRLDECKNHTFDTVLLQNNKELKSVRIHTPLSLLDVSGCRQLETIDVPSIDALDISNTLFPPSPALCTRWGRHALFARNLPETHFQTRVAEAALATCLQLVRVLDLSDNAWLRAPRRIEQVAGGPVALSSQQFETAGGTSVLSRDTPPVFQLQGSPVECGAELERQDLRLANDHSVQVTQLVYSFRCKCTQQHHLSGDADDSECVPDGANIPAIVVGSLAGGTILLVPVILWLYRRYARSHKSDKLHKRLLSERDEEVMALKKAWEIEYDELKLIKRVAAGAFGVVFKAEWDTVMVAVKVLQQGVMMFDETTVQEFEKEVEFLQRTRHPHVVRFFGAGTDPNGSPFLVLEYVAMGSLKELLETDMEEVLVDLRARDTGKGGGDVTMADLGEDLTLVSVTDNDEANAMTVWDLKLRLLRDVASGMAFIHSLDQVHRDLKSGNVLVSTTLRAKITDFGSIRQCLASVNPVATTRWTIGGSTLLYSQAAGTATMNPSMTMTAGVGTPLYMAPEALIGGKYNAKADVFSFGVLMWEVATQRVPDLIEQEKGSDFHGPMLATLSTLLHEGKRLRFEDEDMVPEWFARLTCTCMDINPRERPTFEEIHDDCLQAAQTAA
ncbi:TKL protein kinase [Salpingoeca rosetta]|uniref:TKL protein kinase n=1 Tax=Salpingoeca rosetta (strain ATCC 50818 / BSB-021) TaxID=946362 RepID=F2UN65_SALR5|nr:TKL protein kinase [Salpingoeca rosetta]EGD78564.1 TKL protein kinase [Salpingoeca rosetta]|eukprot:XP_004989513.1 TKL protein kinase [Salpingoeca rosetta]